MRSKIFIQNVFNPWPLKDRTVQSIICSPPYFNLRKYDIPDIEIDGWISQYGLEETFRDYISHTLIWSREAWRVLKDEGIFFLNIGDSFSSSGGSGSVHYAETKHTQFGKKTKNGQYVPPHREKDLPPKCKMMIPERIAIALIDEGGWTLRNHIIWYKRNSLPESVKDRYAKKYESIFMFVKNPKNYYFNLDAVREGYGDWLEKDNKRPMDIIREGQKYRDKVKYGGGGSGFQGHSGQNKADGASLLHPKGKNPGDVWSINNKPSKFEHYACWPELLIERMIKCSTKKGDVVLDCFAGTGETVRVAEEYDRIGIGFDLGYFSVSKENLKNNQKKLF